MAHHLQYAGRGDEAQLAAFEAILRADPLVTGALERARGLALPQWRIVAGALYNTVWNALTGRPPGRGIRDVDLFYYDGADLSWEGEDRVIRRAAARFGEAPPPVEIRNQARVHLWYEGRFGHPIAPLRSTDHSTAEFAALTHCVGVRLEADGRLDICAPYGLEPIIAFRLVPNRRNRSAGTYAEKAARARALWPELTVEPWEGEERA
jgi:hypothetical protein